jgi:hypothetical protein
MSGVFQNIDLPPPSPPGQCVSPAFRAGGGHTRWVERGWGGGVNILEDARHSSLLYICEYTLCFMVLARKWQRQATQRDCLPSLLKVMGAN